MASFIEIAFFADDFLRNVNVLRSSAKTKPHTIAKFSNIYSQVFLLLMGPFSWPVDLVCLSQKAKNVCGLLGYNSTLTEFSRKT